MLHATLRRRGSSEIHNRWPLLMSAQEEAPQGRAVCAADLVQLPFRQGSLLAQTKEGFDVVVSPCYHCASQ